MESVPDARIGTAIRAVADLERDSAGQVRPPRYVCVQRRAGQLACHELVLEPMFGPVRVAGIVGSNGDHPEFVHGTWSDDRGP